MATVSKTIEKLEALGEAVWLVTWSGLGNNDDGDPFEMPSAADRTVQVEGTFGAGGTVRIEGSNDQVNYQPLNDPQGNVLDVTAAKIESLLEVTRSIRPRVTAGDGTTDLDVTMLVRRSR